MSMGIFTCAYDKPLMQKYSNIDVCNFFSKERVKNKSGKNNPHQRVCKSDFIVWLH